MPSYLRKCKKCELKAYSIEELDLFSAHPKSKYGKQNICKVCINDYSRSKEITSEIRHKRKEWHKLQRKNSQSYRDAEYYSRIKGTYGISKETYLEMYEEHHGSCAICNLREEKMQGRLHVDHCHSTGVIRGLLCNKCNTALGLMNDSIDRLQVAKEYLALTPTEIALLQG